MQIKNEIFIVDNFIFNNSSEEEILGIAIDNKLTFKSRCQVDTKIFLDSSTSRHKKHSEKLNNYRQ